MATAIVGGFAPAGYRTVPGGNNIKIGPSDVDIQGLPDGVYAMGIRTIGVPGQPIDRNIPGSGPFAPATTAQAVMSVAGMAPGDVKFYPRWLAYGTYLGSQAFRTVEIELPYTQAAAAVWQGHGGNKGLDKAYGVGNWTVIMTAYFPYCFSRLVQCTSYSLSVGPSGYGFGAVKAQTRSHLFPTNPFRIPGEFSITFYVGTRPLSDYDEFRLYHELRTLTTITPADNTLLMSWAPANRVPRGMNREITATPYPFHRMTSFVIKGTTTGGYVVKTVPITDPHGTTTFTWDSDDHTIAARLLDINLGEILSDVYVTAVSVYDGTKPLPAGSPISIQCNTNECCAPAWEILSTDAPASWNLVINSNGLITGFIPRANPLGVYFIEVQVTGPTQSTSARVYVEVTAALLYGNVWVGKAKVDSNITGLVECGLYVYCCTYEKKIYRALTADLTSWSEVAYVGVATGPFGAIAKLNDNLLCAMELHASGQSKLWTSTDGATWTRGTTNYSGQDLGQGQLFKVNTAVVLWTQAFPGFASNKPVAQLIDATSGLIVETAWNTFIFQNMVPNAVFNAATGRFIYQTAYTGQDGKQFGESGITAVDIPTNPIPLESTIVGANGSMRSPIMLRDGEYTWAPASDQAGIYLRTSTDGTTWTITAIDLASTYRLYPISVLAPILTQIRFDNATGHLYRTTDRWATVNTAVLTDALGNTALSPMPMIELEASGILVFGCSAAVKNIYTSEA